jgi:hypothetical protein
LAPWLASIAAALAASEWLRWQRSKQRDLVGDDEEGNDGAAFSAWTFLGPEDER